MGIKFRNFLALFMSLSFLTTAIAQTIVSGTVMDEKINVPNKYLGIYKEALKYYDKMNKYSI